MSAKPLPAVPKEDETVRFDNVWEAAYVKLQQDQPKLFRAYQDSILEESRLKCKDGRSEKLKSPERSIRGLQGQLAIVMEIQSEHVSETQWVLRLGETNVKMHDVVKKIVKGVRAAKDFITSLASSDPHAALAWAGVSCLLPLLLDAMNQDDDAMDGLSYVHDLLSRYQVVQQVLMENKELSSGGFNDHSMRQKMREAVVTLYFRVLEYQFLMMRHFSKSKSRRFFRNIVDPVVRDDWKAKLTSLKEAEGMTENHRKVLESELQDRISKKLDEQTTELRRILDLAEESKLTEEEKKSIAVQVEIDDWLGRMFPQNMDALHSTLRNAIKDEGDVVDLSGQWFLEEVKKFLESDNKNILWGRGIPGAGKSVLMSSAIRAMSTCLSEHDFDAMAYVYLQWDLKAQQTPAALLASILQKLRRCSKSLTRSLKRLYDDLDKSKTLPEARDLQKILMDYGRKSDLGGKDQQTFETVPARFLVFLDGLDEANDDSRKMLLSCMNGLDSRYATVIVTSRTDLKITTDEIRTRSLEITAHPQDLDIYLRHQLIDAQNDGRIEELTPEVVQELIGNIRDRAQGMFLHAQYHVLSVLKLTNVDEMREAAQKPFDRVNDVYDDVLKHLPFEVQVSAPQPLKALAWLTYAKRTLDRETLEEALAISPGDVCYHEKQRVSIEVITRLCRGLVTYDKSTNIVRLAHQTVQEYLRSHESIVRLHSTLVATCFTRLAMDSGTSQKLNENDFLPDNDSGRFEPPTRKSTADFFAAIDDEQSEDGQVLVEGGSSGISEQPQPSDRLIASCDEVSSGRESRGLDATPESAELQNPTELHLWADQTTAFSVYAGEFALQYLSEAERLSNIILEEIWRMLTRRPSPGLPQLVQGTNTYRVRCTPLHLAVCLGHSGTIERLVRECKINVNIRENQEQTPLMRAANERGPECGISTLLDLGADTTLRNTRGYTAVELLIRDVEEALLQRMIPSSLKLGDDALMLPAQYGHVNVVKVFLERGIGNPNHRIGHRTPLVAACEHGHAEIVEMLCKTPEVDVNNGDGSGIPLLLAVESGKAEVVRALLQSGADPNKVDNRNEHALLRLGWGGRYPEGHLSEHNILGILEVLLPYAPYLDLKGAAAGTALWEAQSAQKYPRVVERLVQAGCDLHAENMGYTPFQRIAATAPGSATFQVLLKAEQDWAKKQGRVFKIALPNLEGNTCLHMAAAAADKRAIKRLLDIPGLDVEADVNGRNLAGKTPLFKALHMRGESIFASLIQARARTDVVDYTGNSILDAALTAAPARVIGSIIWKPCSIEVPWELEQPEIQQFREEPWFERLKQLIQIRAQRVDPVYDVHSSNSLVQPTKVRDSDRDKAILSCTVPHNNVGRGGVRVERITFTFRSRDQGFSWKQDVEGDSWTGCFSWFDVAIRRAAPTQPLEDVRELQLNLHASRQKRWYCITWTRESHDPGVSEWMRSLSSGDQVVVLAQCEGSGWQNQVSNFKIDIYCNRAKDSG